jgi:hypothetical protein
MLKKTLALIGLTLSVSVNAAPLSYLIAGDTAGGSYALILNLDDSVANPCGAANVKYGCYGLGVESFSLDWPGVGEWITSPISGPDSGVASFDVINNHGQLDQLQFSAVIPPQLGYSSVTVRMHLNDSTQTVFSDASFPSALQLSDFDQTWVYIYPVSEGQSGNQVLTATITSITVVPIPAAAWLFGSALLGLAGIGKRRKATQVIVEV